MFNIKVVMDATYFTNNVSEMLKRLSIENIRDITVKDISLIAKEFFGMIEAQNKYGKTL